MRRTAWMTMLAACLAAGPLAAGTLLIDDFADGDLEAAAGLAWLVVGDDVLGGEADAGLAVEEGGEDRALIVDGRLGEPAGPPVSFVGAWTAIGGDGLPRDVSAYEGVRLRARATAGSFQVGLRRAGAVVNFVAPIDATEEWREIDVPFTDLRALRGGDPTPRWSAADVTWIGVTASGTAPAPVHLELDRIGFYGGPDASRAAPSSATGGSRAAKAQLADIGPLAGLEWHALAADAQGDGLHPGLPDARSLAWAMAKDGTVWFRVELAGEAPERWMGLNVALDDDDDAGDGMAWWGSNSDFRFDRLVTAYLNRVEGYWVGSLGVASAGQVAQGIMAGGDVDGVRAAVDRPGRALLVGVPRSALPAGRSVRLIATVGSSMANNDDLPDAGAVEVTFPPAPPR